jgi:hypothetical protein
MDSYVLFCFFLLSFRSIFPIHPSFRIIALAEPPIVGSTTQQWLGPEFLTMFFFHHMKPLVKSEEIQVIKETVRVRPALGTIPSNCVLQKSQRQILNVHFVPRNPFGPPSNWMSAYNMCIKIHQN